MDGLPLEFEAADFACSTFYTQSNEGDYMFGRNFDYGYSPSVIVHTNPGNGYESISMVNLTLITYDAGNLPDAYSDRYAMLAAPYFPVDGMNEKGVAIGVLTVSDAVTNQDTNKVDITTTAAIRLVLDYAATVDEAIALLKQYDMHSVLGGAYHFQISDATGKSVIIEYIDNELTLTEMEASYQICTNFIVAQDTGSLAKSCDRYQTMQSVLDSSNGIISFQEGMDLLQRVTLGAQSTTKEDGGTQWSSLYNNSNLTAVICLGMDYDNVYSYDVDESIGNSSLNLICYCIIGIIGFIIVIIFVRRNKHKA